MISDEDVKQLFQNAWRTKTKGLDLNKPLPDQFFRGVGPGMWENPHPGGCTRHLMVFDRFNIIPRYCFNCYKVLIEPRTVVELFKLMMVFEKLDLPNDNTRKCMVECREKISGTYKGLIYCRGIEEGNAVHKIVREVVTEEISGKIPVTLKRGCSEYALSYPEYAQTKQGATAMSYKEEWQEYEDIADKQMIIDIDPAAKNYTFNSPTYTSEDAHIMLTWLKYAATIGDKSYLKISWRLQPFPNIKRPSPFHPVEDN